MDNERITQHTDKTMIGRILKKNNIGLWLIGQVASLFVGLAVGIDYGVSLGFVACFHISILVDIRANLG